MNRTSRQVGGAIILVAMGFGAGHLGVAAPFTSASPGPVLQQGQSYSLTAEERQSTGTAANVSRNVVQVENTGVGLGSGVIASANGYIITNNHVVAGGTSYFITLWNGRRVPARLVGTDQADDLAVMKVNMTGLPVARFGNSSKLTIAQSVLAIGNPLGLGETVTMGVISALNRTVSEGQGASYLPDAIQTSAQINPGNSGGALVSLDGQVVGIPTLVASDPQVGGAAQGIGFAIPSNVVIRVANQIIADGRVIHTGRAFLGITSTDNTGQSAANPFGNQQPSTPSVAGALIQGVGAGTPASSAGLQQGDIITSLQGHTINGQDSLLATLANLRPGQKVAIGVVRQNPNTGANSRMTLHTTLSEAAANPQG